MHHGRFVTKCLAGVALLFTALLWFTTPSFNDFRSREAGSDKYFYDRHGQLIQIIRENHNRKQLPWISIDDVSPKFVDILLFAEDRRFWLHPGVDPIGIGRAVIRSRRFGSQGGSTITMQLASRMSPLNATLRSRSPFVAKMFQVMQAFGLELRWTKREILTAYLNIVPFRGEQVGLAAAALAVFDKSPSELSLQEGAILIAMIRSPNAPLDLMARRACHLLSIEHYNLDDCPRTIVERIERAGVQKSRSHVYANLIPHFGRRILQSKADHQSQFYTSIDGNLQRQVIHIIDNRLSETLKQNAHDAAVIVVDNETSEILAYVGGSQTYSTASHVDGADAARQAGSTLKPFLYGRAIDRHLITAATILDDAPTEHAISAGGVFQPRNFDEKFRGPVTVRDALAGSLNIPAIRVIEMLGVDDALATLRALGMKTLKDADYYGPSLALGAADLSLTELVEAYVTLANLGSHRPLKAIKGEGGEILTNQVISREASVIIRSILSDNVARAPTFGLNSALFTAVDTAVKTGTSKDMRDNWCIGFSDQYTVGVWVGNFSGASMWNLTGIAGAAPIWSDIMHLLHKDKASKFDLPADLDLVTKRVSFSFRKASTEEIFISGSEPETSMIEEIKKSYRVRIDYPTDQSILAIDPEIPQGNQKIIFSSTASSLASSLASSNQPVWELNGVPLGIASKETPWTPRKGRFELSIIDSTNGRVMDRVRFQVR